MVSVAAMLESGAVQFTAKGIVLKRDWRYNQYHISCNYSLCNVYDFTWEIRLT